MTRNPYEEEGGLPSLRQSVFVFMDILGYEEMIRSSEVAGTQQDLLIELHVALSQTRNWLDDKNLTPAPANLLPKDLFVLKAFTDNIVLGWPIRQDAESETGSAFFKIAGFQFEMATRGFFLRGALSVGCAYIDDITVYGDALTQAYDGERRLARDPRIILTNSAVATVKHHLTYYSHPRHSPQSRALLCDADGQWFVNYLNCVFIAGEEYGPYYDELMKHKVSVETKLLEFKNIPPVFSKYAWVAGYHNFFCDLHNHYFSAEYKIDPESFRAVPKLITD